MAADQTSFKALDTDTPPDRLGDRALRLLNVMPGSPSSVRPRHGVTEAARYTPGALGRLLIVDGLPDNTAGVLITCVQTTESAVQVVRVDAFWPRFAASRYSGVLGLNLSEIVYGVTT
jgi:hypothetical protein